MQKLNVYEPTEEDMVYLSKYEKDDPFGVFDKFFYYYNPEEFREVLQKWVQGYIISSFQIAQQSRDVFKVVNTSNAMSEALDAQRDFERLIDAAFLIYLRHEEELTKKKEEELKKKKGA